MKIRYLLLPFILHLGLAALAQTQDQVRQLVPGQPIEGEIAGGESHTYQISLTAGQFARVVVEQKAVDVALVLSAPDGKQLVEANLTAVGGLESMSAEAASSGNYRLTVRAVGAGKLAGSYQVRLEVKPAATAQDIQRFAAERWMREANELRKQEAKTAEQAIDKLQQALTVWRELSDPYWTAWCLSSIGAAYNSLNRFEKAIEYFQQALPILRELKNRRAEGSALNNLGNSHVYLNHYDKAIEYIEQALGIAREVKNRSGEGSALISLGNVYYVQSRYEKAIEYYEETLGIFREVKNRSAEGSTLNNLGLSYSNLNRYQKAIEYYEQALALAREVKDRGGEGWTLNNLGSSYSSLSRYEKAIECHEQALAIHREVKDRWGEGDTLNFLGTDYYNLNRYEKAIEYYELALAINREVKNRFGEGIVLNGLGQAYEKTRRYEKAIEYYEQALTINREVKNRLTEADTLYNWARTETARGNLSSARTHVEESLRINESTRADVSSPESRASFLTAVQSSYQLYTDVLMRQHQAEPAKGFDALAIEVSERQRARSLLDLLSEAHADVRQGVDPALIERESLLAKQLNDKAQTQTNTTAQADALKREISQLETDLERAQAAIRKANPHYAALVQPQPLKLKEIQQQLDADTLLIEYSLGEDRSYLWAMTTNSLTGYELPKGELIEKDARQVYQLLTARSISKRGETAAQKQERISHAEANLPAAARGLSQTILAPVAAELGHKRLIIVADGALQYIPFAMLPEPGRGEGERGRGGEGKSIAVSPGRPVAASPRLPLVLTPLVVNHEIVSLPSASALAIQRSELAGRQLAPKMLAVIADPVFDRSDTRFTKPLREFTAGTREQTFGADDARSIEHLADNSADKSDVTTHRLVIPRLPFTRQEATQLLALAPKNSSFSAIDFQANRETVLNPALSQYRYVHFATHGLLDSERPGLSSLVLSMIDAQGAPQEGFLRANDIYNLKLPAELVVLSACQTGLGKDIKGEGLVGLTRGFMYAGAARVVVSLWSVNDKATAELMTKFYEKMLKQGERPASALRAAQVEMWKQKQWQSPYYWAAFTMQGEWR